MDSKLKHLNIEYLGFEEPKTPTEIQFQILGLETVIAEAQKKISELKQGMALAKVIAERERNDNHTGEGSK